MGLDVVTFVLDVEEAFEIRIPGDAAETLATPRKLIDHVYSQLPRSQEARCLSQRAFYSVRRALSEQVGLVRSSLRPDTELFTVLTQRNSQEVWAAVGAAVRITRWPRFRGAGWLAWLFQRGPRTLGEAASYVATFAPCALKPPDEGWSWHEVAKVVDGLMRYHFAVRDYFLADRFVEDLGLD